MKKQNDDEIKCKKCGHAKKHHCDPPVRGNDEQEGHTYGILLWCCPPYPMRGVSCGCDGFLDGRPLSIKQKAALVRMLDLFWKPPKGDGRVIHGFRQTLYSLKARNLVMQHLAGWVLTRAGEKEARSEQKKNDPAVNKELRR